VVCGFVQAREVMDGHGLVKWWMAGEGDTTTLLVHQLC